MKKDFKSYVISEWRDDLQNLPEKTKKFFDALVSLNQVTTLLKGFKNPNNDLQQKELYKLCIICLATGMTDVKSDNFMLDSKNFPVIIDTGFSYFSETKQFDKWAQIINLLKEDSSEEVRQWGIEIEKYKNYVVDTAENKESIIESFKSSANSKMNEGYRSRIPAIKTEVEPNSSDVKQTARLTGGYNLKGF